MCDCCYCECREDEAQAEADRLYRLEWFPYVTVWQRPASPLEKLIKAFYLPALNEDLNRPSFLSTFVGSADNDAKKGHGVG